MKDEGQQQSRGVGSIDAAGRVLKALVAAKRPMKLRDLALATGMSGPQLHPYLVSFRRMELVEQVDRGLYRLGPFALHLGLTRLRSQDAYRETIARVGALSDELGLMISLSVWGPFGPAIVYVQEYARRIHANVQVGGNYDMTVTATGKVFAAFLPDHMTRPVIDSELADGEARRRAIFRVSEVAFREAVAAVAVTGYATTTDMPIPGVSAIAAPVFDHTGQMQLCVTAIGPTGMIDLSPGGPTVAAVLAFTRKLSTDLGYEPDQAFPPAMWRAAI